MEYRTLGRTGLKVSPLCLGSMQFGWAADELTSFEVLTTAYQAGINFIDTADIYSRWVPGNPGGVSETIIGNWMKQNRVPREHIVLATKVHGPMGTGPNDQGLSRVHILKAVEDSLRRLQTDYIDLYQAHWPDENTPIEETLDTLNDLVHQGKVRYIGCSNYSAWQLVQALWVSDRHGLARFDSIQPHYNLVHRCDFEPELQTVCRTYGLGVLPYSPLAGGFLTGKYHRAGIQPDSVRKGEVSRYMTDRNWTLLTLLEQIAMASGDHSISQVALAWMLTNPLITSPIIGPHNPMQLVDNLGALELRLTEKDLERIGQASCLKENDPEEN